MMRVIDFPDYTGHTIFCDDIRNEVGNKFTFVGVYPAHMFVHSDLPATLPKFAFSITLLQRKAVAITKNLKLRIYLPGAEESGPPSIEAPLPDDVLATAGASGDNAEELVAEDGPKPAFMAMNFHFVFAPLIISQEGSIRVRALLADNLVKLGSLTVKRAPADSSQTPTI
jgi:hypothetical protein